jgi:hypothetical protein
MFGIKNDLSKYSRLIECLEAYKLSNPVIQEVIDASIDYYKCHIELELIKKNKQMSIDYYSSW